MTHDTQLHPPATELAARRRPRSGRVRAVAAALAAGGVASLGVVLVGSPTMPGPHRTEVVSAAAALDGVQPSRRADVTLGESA